MTIADALAHRYSAMYRESSPITSQVTRETRSSRRERRILCLVELHIARLVRVLTKLHELTDPKDLSHLVRTYLLDALHAARVLPAEKPLYNHTTTTAAFVQSQVAKVLSSTLARRNAEHVRRAGGVILRAVVLADRHGRDGLRAVLDHWLDAFVFRDANKRECYPGEIHEAQARKRKRTICVVGSAGRHEMQGRGWKFGEGMA